MSEEKLAPAKLCVICGKPSVERYRPFCSARCSNVDLNRWLSGVYAVPAEPAEDEAGSSASRGEGDARDEEQGEP
jgi:endogenous inhibitor of DNA gyrase (YacG/DUF329 family)